MSNDFYNQSILPHAGIIIKICRAYSQSNEDFEDYYQEVCLQIWRSRDRFEGKSEWTTWIYRLALNVCMTMVKKDKRHQSSLVPNTSSTLESEESTFFNDESLNQLYGAIRQLSEVNKAIILLYLEEQTYNQIADIIGISSSNIGVRISRIKKQLKTLLDGKIN